VNLANSRLVQVEYAQLLTTARRKHRPETTAWRPRDTCSQSGPAGSARATSARTPTHKACFRSSQLQVSNVRRRRQHHRSRRRLDDQCSRFCFVIKMDSAACSGQPRLPSATRTISASACYGEKGGHRLVARKTQPTYHSSATVSRPDHPRGTAPTPPAGETQPAASPAAIAKAISKPLPSLRPHRRTNLRAPK